MGSDLQGRNSSQASDWGGLLVRFAAWLLVVACVFAIFYGMTTRPTKRPAQPYMIPQSEPHPNPTEPAGSKPMPREQQYRYSV